MAGVTIPPPPRFTGNTDVDLPSALQWMHAFYEAAIVQGGVLQASVQLGDDSDFDPSTLPDPASTTVAQAQQTANEAYTLSAANSAAIEALRLRLREVGQATVSGTSTTIAVVFDEAEDDAGYHVIATPVDSTGTPATESFVIADIAKTANGFTLTVDTAPGAGNTVVFDYAVLRPASS